MHTNFGDNRSPFTSFFKRKKADFSRKSMEEKGLEEEEERENKIGEKKKVGKGGRYRIRFR